MFLRAFKKLPVQADISWRITLKVITPFVSLYVSSCIEKIRNRWEIASFALKFSNVLRNYVIVTKLRDELSLMRSYGLRAPHDRCEHANPGDNWRSCQIPVCSIVCTNKRLFSNFSAKASINTGVTAPTKLIVDQNIG